MLAGCKWFHPGAEEDAGPSDTVSDLVRGLRGPKGHVELRSKVAGCKSVGCRSRGLLLDSLDPAAPRGY